MNVNDLLSPETVASMKTSRAPVADRKEGRVHTAEGGAGELEDGGLSRVLLRPGLPHVASLAFV